MTARVHRATTWPLLRKDLTEMAAQGRGYWLRMLAVVLVFGGFFFVAQRGVYGFFGLNFIVACILTAIAPAVVASAIAGEKDRNSFALLLITDLKPRELLLQKFMARLIPLLSLLFCLLPLYAVCYSEGGVEVSDMAQSMALLILCVLQAGAVGLCCSCRFQTPAGALVAAWIFYGLVILTAEVLASPGLPREYAHILTGPYHLYQIGLNLAYPRFSGNLSYGWRLLVMGGSTSIFLLMARYFLLRRAFPAPGSRRLRFVRWLHARLDWVRGRRRGGTMLPEADGVVWRERHRLGITNFRFSTRLLVASALLFAATACSIIILFNRHGVRTVLTILWILMVIAWLAAGVVAVHADRRRRTADCMSVLPGGMVRVMRARGAAHSRFSLLLIPSLLGMTGLVWWTDCWYLSPHDWALLLVSQFGVWLVHPFLFLWLGMLAGSFIKSTARALPVALGLCFMWWIVADVLVSASEVSIFALRQATRGFFNPLLFCAHLSNPFTLTYELLGRSNFLVTEFLRWWPPIVCLFHGFLAVGLRAWTLRRIQRTYG